MRRTSLLFLVATFLVAAEPSVFGAGDLTLDEPYGLTPNEQMIHQNRQAIVRLERRLSALEQESSDLKERTVGLQEMIRGNGENIRRLSQQMQRLTEAFERTQADEQRQGEALEEALEQLQEEVVAALVIQDSNHQRLAHALSELQSDLEKSASQEAMQRNLSRLAEAIEANRDAIAELQGVTTPLTLEQTPLEELFEQAKAMIEAREYGGAQVRLTRLIEEEFRLAESYFHLGSVHYFRQEDERAVAAFKRSAEMDDEARHMPVLLFYTAIALARQGSEAEAKRFFETLIRLYPDHSVTPSARSRLERLEG